MAYIRNQDKKESIKNQKKGRNKTYGTLICPYCQKEVERYNSKQYVCTDKKCISQRNKDRIQKMKTEDPIKYKARSLSGSVRLGKDKIKIMVNLITEALKKPCIFCGTELTTDNISLDHKEPIYHTRLYDRKNHKSLKTYEELRHLHRPENLQIICYDCNQIKGDLNNVNFTRLSEFLEKNPIIKEYVRRKIKASRVYFGFNRKK